MSEARAVQMNGLGALVVAIDVGTDGVLPDRGRPAAEPVLGFPIPARTAAPSDPRAVADPLAFPPADSFPDPNSLP